MRCTNRRPPLNRVATAVNLRTSAPVKADLLADGSLLSTTIVVPKSGPLLKPLKLVGSPNGQSYLVAAAVVDRSGTASRSVAAINTAAHNNCSITVSGCHNVHARPAAGELQTQSLPPIMTSAPLIRSVSRPPAPTAMSMVMESSTTQTMQGVGHISQQPPTGYQSVYQPLQPVSSSEILYSRMPVTTQTPFLVTPT